MATGTASLKEAINMFGSDYMAGQKKSILANVSQSAVSSGLSGTTRPGAVSSGMLADLETTRRTKLAGLMSQLAQMESQERMEAERLGLSKAALELEKAKFASQSQLAKTQLKLQAAAQAPSSQWMQSVSPATIAHQQGVASRIPGANRFGGIGGSVSGGSGGIFSSGIRSYRF